MCLCFAGTINSDYIMSRNYFSNVNEPKSYDPATHQVTQLSTVYGPGYGGMQWWELWYVYS